MRCAPPDNKPTTIERDNCAPWLQREIELVAETLTVVIALGSFGWNAALRAFAGSGWSIPRPRTRFGHGVQVRLDSPNRGDVLVIGSYHPSQQNTFTGRLTESMLDPIFLAAKAELAAR